jgi:peptidoglycan/LPS O-acetylase OafA/YrhL
MHNYFTHPDGETYPCYASGWSVACQMQLFFVTPAVVAVFSKSKNLGYALCIFLVGLCLALRATSEWDYYIMYYRTHLRMGSFFIGVMFHFLRKYSVFSKD